MFPAGPQPRPSEPSVPCRTSTATISGQCSLPDLNRNRLAQCSLPGLNRDHLRPAFPAGPQSRDRMSEDMSERMPGDMPEGMSERMSEDMSWDLLRPLYIVVLWIC